MLLFVALHRLRHVLHVPHLHVAPLQHNRHSPLARASSDLHLQTTLGKLIVWHCARFLKRDAACRLMELSCSPSSMSSYGCVQRWQQCPLQPSPAPGLSTWSLCCKL